MIQKRVFRIEHDPKDGSIRSCQEVDSKGRNGGIVRYYEALSEAEACSLAKQWWQQRISATSGMRDAKQSTHQSERAAALQRKHEASQARSAAMRERYRTQGNPLYRHILQRFDELGPLAFRAWLASKLPQDEPEQAYVPIAAE